MSHARLPLWRPEAPAARPGPHLAALEALWAQVAEERLYAPRHFWRRLMLRRRLRLREVSADEVTVVGPPAPLAMVNDCANCLDNCCVGDQATVLLRLRDIAVLMDLGREDLISHDKPTFSARQRAARPGLGRQVGSASWQIFPVLAKNSFGACRALDDEGGCTLYPHWPLSCARFPWALDVEASELFFSQRCPSYWVRPDARPRVAAMKAAAVAAYNARIRDALLLELAAAELRAMGLWRHLRVPVGRRRSAELSRRRPSTAP